MHKKRSIIVLLVGLNLMLLGLLVAGTYSPSAAYAQSRPSARPGDIVQVTAKAKSQNYDVLYVLDVPEQKLHAFYPSNVAARKYGYGKFIDLKAEFAE